MNTLRSPGGCAWDAEQTHQSLTNYALEEAYEVVEAIENGTRADLLEELGDLLLQVVFHARIAQEHSDDPFDFDDVSRGITAKLRRRHPHVFQDQPLPEASADAIIDDDDPFAELAVTWDQLKREEKQRESVVDGIPAALPALARAQKVIGRARRAGFSGPTLVAKSDSPETIGAELLDLARRAQAAGIDAEAMLRSEIRVLEDSIRAKELDADAAAEPDSTP